MFELNDIIKSANIYLSAKDKDLRYLYCNENVADSLGLDSPKQIVGKTDYDLFSDDVARLYRFGDVKVLKGGVLLNTREIHPHAHRRTMQILTTKSLLRNNKGDLSGVVVSFVDITNSTLSPALPTMQYDDNSRSYQFIVGNQPESFTQREYEVFENILRGSTAKQIAKKLSLSPRTVEWYIETIKLKLQCTSKYRIAETAMRLGIV